ncbi:hypothetical protein GCM10023238_07280 [Streptomyces heliomycini]
MRAWEGCSVLRGARETASCAWVAQHAPGNPKALAEFRRRVASLRDGDESVRWYPSDPDRAARRTRSPAGSRARKGSTRPDRQPRG